MMMLLLVFFLLPFVACQRIISGNSYPNGPSASVTVNGNPWATWISSSSPDTLLVATINEQSGFWTVVAKQEQGAGPLSPPSMAYDKTLGVLTSVITGAGSVLVYKSTWNGYFVTTSLILTIVPPQTVSLQALASVGGVPTVFFWSNNRLVVYRENPAGGPVQRQFATSSAVESLSVVESPSHFPWVAYFDVDAKTLNFAARVGPALTDGYAVEEVATNGGKFACLSLVGARPYISYQDIPSLTLRVSYKSSGQSAWTSISIPHSSYAASGFSTSMIPLSFGQIAIAHAFQRSGDENNRVGIVVLQTSSMLSVHYAIDLDDVSALDLGTSVTFFKDQVPCVTFTTVSGFSGGGTPLVQYDCGCWINATVLPPSPCIRGPPSTLPATDPTTESSSLPSVSSSSFASDTDVPQTDVLVPAPVPPRTETPLSTVPSPIPSSGPLPPSVQPQDDSPIFTPSPPTSTVMYVVIGSLSLLVFLLAVTLLVALRRRKQDPPAIADASGTALSAPAIVPGIADMDIKIRSTGSSSSGGGSLGARSPRKRRSRSNSQHRQGRSGRSRRSSQSSRAATEATYAQFGSRLTGGQYAAGSTYASAPGVPAASSAYAPGPIVGSSGGYASAPGMPNASTDAGTDTGSVVLQRAHYASLATGPNHGYAAVNPEPLYNQLQLSDPGVAVYDQPFSSFHAASQTENQYESVNHPLGSCVESKD